MRSMKSGVALALWSACLAAYEIDFDVPDVEAYESAPSSEVRIAITAQDEHVLEAMLRDFAESHNYRLRVARVQPVEPRFVVTMWRADSLIVGTNPFELGIYRFGIHPRRGQPLNDASWGRSLADLQTAVAK